MQGTNANFPARLAFLLILVSAAPALADGKFFIREELPPPGLPYQRALILFDGEREVLVLQSRYEFADEQAVADFGWVVPVPAKPELAPLSAQSAEDLFSDLDSPSHPDVTTVHWPEVVFMFHALGLLVLTVWLVKNRRHWGLVVCSAIGALLLVLFSLAFFFSAGFGPSFAAVEVLEDTTVGNYDVKVVRADEAGGLLDWLKENGFSCDREDTEVFAEYTRRNWCFVTVRITPEAASGAAEAYQDGLPDALVLDFPTKQAVYPLALTATIGEETEVLLYVIARHRMSAGERMETRAAVRGPESGYEFYYTWSVARDEDTPSCLKDPRFDLPWLTKFKERLSPGEMREDLVLDYAEKDEPYREHVWRWFP